MQYEQFLMFQLKLLISCYIGRMMRMMIKDQMKCWVTESGEDFF
jgi:hypothetical protein